MNNSDVLVSLDIGTSTIKVIIGEVLNDSLNIIGVGTAESRGMKKGAIVDIDETVHSIQSAIQKAEHMVGMEINRVVVGINGNHVQLQPCHGVVAVQSENKEITQDDVTRVIDAAQVISIPPEREIIDVIPKQFIVDNLDEITDPKGMIGVRLEVEGSIITCSKTVLHNLLKCVEKAGLEILDICLQPLASGTIALSTDERNIGVTLINVGAGCSTVSIYENNRMIQTSVIPLGGDNITKDITYGIRTSTNEAETIKQNYGHAFVDDARVDETFQTTVIGSDDKKTISQLDLAYIIEARLEEIYGFAEREIQRLGYDDLPGGYVLTGGTMKIPGAMELARDVFQSNIRIATPDYIGVREPQYTPGVGILQFAYKNAKIQGKALLPSVSVGRQETQTKPVKKKRKNVEKHAEEQGESKIAKFFKSFFE